MAVPQAFKEVDGWKPAQPQDAVDRGAWWQIYHDDLLDSLEPQIDISNQTIKAAEAAYRRARAVVDEARAAFLPTITGNASATRSGQGPGGSSRGGSSRVGGGGGVASNSYSVAADASWTLDLWGRIRRTVESDVANAQVSAADLASARLSAQSELASDYLELRVLDEEARLFSASVDAFERTYQITKNEYSAGTASAADVAQALTQLEATRGQLVNVGVLRAQDEHAIAVLIGKAPADFAIPPYPEPLNAPIVVVPPGVPSALLERRPDIAGAERQVAAANAQIGVAIAGYYPDVTLSASYGFASPEIGRLLALTNNVWSFGPKLAQTLFDAGAIKAQVAQARAGYDQSVANYREAVLTAFAQVEDQLAALRILAEQAAVVDRAVKAARDAERLTFNQYLAGTVNYTSVVTTQTARLSNEQNALTVLRNRLVASVSLVQALGGGWRAADLPDVQKVEAGGPTGVGFVDRALPQ